MKQHGAFKNVLTSILTHSMKFISKHGVMCRTPQNACETANEYIN